MIYYLPTPLAGGQRKIICGANEFSLAFGQGGGHLIFDVCFDFQCATPRGLIRWVTVWGNGALQAANLIFHCATPRGLIRWVTVWGNGSLLAANSTRYCAGLDDATPSCLIPIETSGHDVRNGSPQFLYFLYFQAVFLFFHKKCISCISLWKTSHR